MEDGRGASSFVCHSGRVGGRGGDEVAGVEWNESSLDRDEKEEIGGSEMVEDGVGWVATPDAAAVVV